MSESERDREKDRERGESGQLRISFSPSIMGSRDQTLRQKFYILGHFAGHSVGVLKFTNVVKHC